MVIWLIGISGAGKTTLGLRMKAYLNGLGRKAFIIDGDLVRDFFDNDLGYSIEDRKANVKRIILAAHVLNESGMNTIVCNIHPFEELRRFARLKIRDYNEVYLRRSIEISRNNDVKQMYGKNLGRTEIVGVDFKFEEPVNSDLILDTDMQTEEESFALLLAYLKKKYPEEF